MIVSAMNNPTDWEDAPLDPADILDGEPMAFITPLANTEDGALSSGFWRCTAGRFNWHYGVDEVIHILEGTARIRDHAHVVWRDIGPGDSVLFPRGSSAEWIVDKHVRKFYVTMGPRKSLVRRVAKRLLRIWGRHEIIRKINEKIFCK
jgi:uncharacterized cupin superfamily protein